MNTKSQEAYFEILNEAFHETKKVLCSPDVTRHCLCSAGKQSSHVTTMLGSHDTNLEEFHQGELQYMYVRYSLSITVHVYNITHTHTHTWVGHLNISFSVFSGLLEVFNEKNSIGMRGIACFIITNY